MRDSRRANEEVDWNELAGIYVVGGASAFPPVYRLLREKFGGTTFRRYTGSVGWLMRHCTAEDADRIAAEVDAVVGTTAD